MQARIAPLSGAEVSTNGWATRWGAFWIAFFVLQLLQANGTVPTAAPHQPDLVFGMWVVGLAYVTWTCALGDLVHRHGDGAARHRRQARPVSTAGAER